MSEFTKKAVEMLLKGATLVKEPCPYCKGVRIMKDGNAFCANCGKGGVDETPLQNNQGPPQEDMSAADKLDQKLRDLAEDLRLEKDHEKQQLILKSINDIIAIKEKLKDL